MRGDDQSWRHCGRSYVVGGRDHLISCGAGAGGFSWPPRSYSCSFCRREFRSAQALGGHMNVHRRDRARLRQSPPWDDPPPSSSSSSNPNPKSTLNAAVTANVVPNLNMPPPPEAGKHSSPVLYTFHSLLSPLEDMGRSPAVALKALRGVGEWGNIVEEEEEEGDQTDDTDRMVVMRPKETNPVVRLRLDLAAACGDFEDSLDLELRLGYP